MRRWLAILACLVLGVVINVGVAWWLNTAAVGGMQFVTLRGAEAAAKGWAVAVPPDWDSPNLWQQTGSVGRTEVMVVAGAFENNYGSWTSMSWAGDQILSLQDVGWPMRALRSKRFGMFEGSAGVQVRSIVTRFVSWRVGIMRLAPPITPESGNHVTYFPARPIWPGFSFNSVLFGAIIWSALLGCTQMRRWLRRRRGVCPACGYDLKGDTASGCPECGWNRPPSPTPQVVP